jgi:hypothetical protein
MQISMNEILKNVQTRTKSRKEGLYCTIQGRSKSAKGNFDYLCFVYGGDIIEQSGLKEGDYINLVYNNETRQGYLEGASVTTGRQSRKYNTKGKKIIVRFPLVSGYSLPYPAKTVELLNVRTKRGKISFTYEGDILK